MNENTYQPGQKVTLNVSAPLWADPSFPVVPFAGTYLELDGATERLHWIEFDTGFGMEKSYFYSDEVSAA